MLSYRQAHAATYGLENNPCEAWSSQPALIDVLQTHCDATLDLIGRRSRELGEAIDSPTAGEGRAAELQADLKKQITDLADFLLHMYVEREEFLVRCAPFSLAQRRALIGGARSDAPATTIKALQERYAHARSQAIRGLVEVDRAPYAFKLGEQYRDYRMLVELSHSRFAAPGQTQSYMQRFGEDFAFELYQWLIEQGERSDY